MRMRMLLFFIIFAILAGGIVGRTSIAHAVAVNISTSIPGSAPSTGTSGPGSYIANFYQFALLIGGVLALAVVVYGGILYMTSVGNPSGMDEAKKWLEAALLGILLLAGAYLLLKLINPQLVNLVLPTLQNTGQTANGVATTTESGGGSNSTSTSNGTSTQGFSCQLTTNGGTNGSCPNRSDGTVQNCCNFNGSAVCQTGGCVAAVVCGSTDSQGNSQKGTCNPGGTCYSYIGWSQKTVWNCKYTVL